jgi:hypothetical protein
MNQSEYKDNNLDQYIYRDNSLGYFLKQNDCTDLFESIPLKVFTLEYNGEKWDRVELY